MLTSPSDTCIDDAGVIAAVAPTKALETKVALLTGGQDRPYAFGLAMALAAIGTRIDVLGSDEIDSPEMHSTPNLRFLNIKGNWRGSGQAAKAWKLAILYARLLRYVTTTQAKVLHILWNTRVELFDRTIFMMYLKALGKKVTLTAHNINAGKRDGCDTWRNRATLRFQYQLADHIFVHTTKMKDELLADFGIRESVITVLRHPVNDAFPDSDLTPAEAKARLGLKKQHKIILAFGRIRPYKGVEYLLKAFDQIASCDPDYRLVIAGESKKGCEEYFAEIERMIENTPYRTRILKKVEFIPDHDAELYLKAADVMVLPYKEIFQSGVLFLSYSFGLPVVVADVGSFREEVVEGQTGFVCQPCDADDLARTLQKYFASDMFRALDTRRAWLREYAFEQHSWKAVGELTQQVYAQLVKV